MKVRLLIVLTAGLLLPAVALGQETKDKDQEQQQKLQDELGTYEKQLWEASIKSNPDTLKTLLADDYQEVGSPAGSEMNKEQVLESLKDFRISADESGVENDEVYPLTKDVALLTYLVSLKGSLKGQDFPLTRYFISTTWVNRGGKWQAVFRQWTPLEAPPPKEPPPVIMIPSPPMVRKEPPPAVIDTFEYDVTPNNLRLTYKGTNRLEDVQASISLDRQKAVEADWPLWQPGETKEIALSFLTQPGGKVGRLDLSGTAMMNGKKILLKEQPPSPPPIDAFELRILPHTLLYTYKGATKLEDVRLSASLVFSTGRLANVERYWATWQPGETKAIDLDFLTRMANEAERIEMTGTGLRDGRRVRLTNTTRRETEPPSGAGQPGD